jgi:hypothetical protein
MTMLRSLVGTGEKVDDDGFSVCSAIGRRTVRGKGVVDGRAAAEH